jgi:hypothetical protein
MKTDGRSLGTFKSNALSENGEQLSQWIGEYFHILSFFEDLKRITYYYVVSELPHIVHSSTVV